MAEHYAPGLQKIFYRSTSGKSVRVELYLSENNEKLEAEIPLTELILKFPGLYYFEYNFKAEVYLASFFENGIFKMSQVYYVKPLPSEPTKWPSGNFRRGFGNLLNG